jgi:hypothetical protein
MRTNTMIDAALQEILATAGWNPDGVGRWVHGTPRDDARLRYISSQGDWLHFLLEGGAIGSPAPKQVLAQNGRLYGPLKYVARKRREATCRADLPREFPSAGRDRRVKLSDLDGDAMQTQDPRAAWCRAITAAATGQNDPLPVMSPPDEEVVEQLCRAGWSASLDEGRLHVHLHMPGLFRQVSVEITDPPGFKVVADLMELDGVGGAWRRSVLKLARQANDRCPLVRVTLDENTSPSVLRAEVHVGCAPISGVWLPTALAVVEAAVTLTAHPMQALRDRELAELVLAADAA